MTRAFPRGRYEDLVRDPAAYVGEFAARHALLWRRANATAARFEGLPVSVRRARARARACALSLSTLVRRLPPTSRAPPRPRSKWRKDEPRTFEEYRAYYVDEAWKAEYSGYPAKARPEDLHFVNRELDGGCLASLGYERFELPIPDAAGSPGASGGGGGAKPKAKKKTKPKTATATGAERRRPETTVAVEDDGEVIDLDAQPEGAT